MFHLREIHSDQHQGQFPRKTGGEKKINLGGQYLFIFLIAARRMCGCFLTRACGVSSFPLWAATLLEAGQTTSHLHKFAQVEPEEEPGPPLGISNYVSPLWQTLSSDVTGNVLSYSLDVCT